MHPAVTLLTALYRDKGDNELIELRNISHGRVENNTWIVTPSAIEEILPEDATDWYFGVNLRSTRGSNTEAVSRIVAYVADLDIHDEPLTPIAALYGLIPSAVIKTGGGYHLYWFLDTPQPNTVEHTKQRELFCKLSRSDSVFDAARILRVPGTYNGKYDNLPTVTIVSCNPELRYPDAAFKSIVRVHEKARRRLYTGDVSGYKSKSERDWAIIRRLIEAGLDDDQIRMIMFTSPSGDRYRARWPSLIDHDLEAARAAAPSTGGEIYSDEAQNAYFKSTGNGLVKLSTFTFDPTALLVSPDEEDDYLVGDIRAEGTAHIWRDVRLSKQAFLDKRALNKALNKAAWSWLGTDGDANKLLPMLMTEIQRREIPILQLVKALGRQGVSWVTADNVIAPSGQMSFGDAGYSYLNIHQERPNLEYNFSLSKDEYKAYCGALFKNLLVVNKPDVVLPVLCWFFAAAYKPLLSPFGREFPILQTVGTRGAGKTSLIRNLMLPLMGYANPISYSCDTTDFVLLSLMTSTTSIPVALSEYRASISNIERLLRRLRMSYDSGYDARGRPNQTTQSYHLSAPVCVDGEMPIDDAAIQERSIIVTLHPEDITDARREAYERASILAAQNRFAGPFVQWSLSHSPPLQEAAEACEFLKTRLPDRILKNVIRLVCGYLIMRNYLTDIIELPKLNSTYIEMLTQDWLGHVLLGSTGRTAILIDEMVEDIVLSAVQEKNTAVVVGVRNLSSSRPFLWRFDTDTGVLYFNMASVISWWAQRRRSRGLASLTRAAALNQLQERQGQYAIASSPMYTVVGTTSMHGINIRAAIAAGLDIPLGERKGGAKE